MRRDPSTRILAPLRGHDPKALRAVAKRLKEEETEGTDGEAWAVGEMVERAVMLLEDGYREG